MENPCLKCIKTKKPDKCDNKHCAVWRRWFICEWDKMRAKHILDLIDRIEGEDTGGN